MRSMCDDGKVRNIQGYPDIAGGTMVGQPQMEDISRGRVWGVEAGG